MQITVTDHTQLKMKVKCPTCGQEIEYSSANPWRPFCSERCKLIDLGEWASDGYVIEGDPGSADRMTPEELESVARHTVELEERKGGRRRR